MTETKRTTRKATTTKRAKNAADSTSRRSSLEIKIGVQHSPREIVLDVDLSADEVAELLTQATADATPLVLADVKGRRVLIPADKLTYIEIGEPHQRRVGFGAS